MPEETSTQTSEVIDDALKELSPIDEKNVSKQEDFMPTPGMIVWVDHAVEMIGEPITKIADTANITEQTFHRWKREVPGFWDWYVHEFTKKRSRLIPELNKIAMQHAKRGSFSHLELLTKQVGDYPDKPATQVNIAGNEMSIQFVGDSDE